VRLINAVLYSDQVIAENAKIDVRLVELLRDRGPRIGYVASGPDPERRFYTAKRVYYARYGFDLAPFYEPGGMDDQGESDALLASDAIHLSGGDTVAFLRRLQRSGMLGRLRCWAAAGGLMIGTSAGALLMTPTIALDALYRGGEPGEIEDAAALDLVPFEFFPHLQAKHTYFDALVAYSARTARLIAACRDGDGIVVANGAVECCGDIVWLSGGAVVACPY
jgi:dipeptidase E